MDATTRLRGIAQCLAGALAAAPTVQAVALTGSVALEAADEGSDIDLIVFHTAPPTLSALDEIRAQVNGSGRFYSSSAQGTARFKEGHFVKGIRCDLSHLTLEALDNDLALEALDNDLALVLKAHSTDAHAQSRVNGIQNCLPLSGNSLVQGYQDASADYPAELRRKMLEEHLSFPPFWVLTEMSVKRGELLFLYQMLADAEKTFSASCAA